MFDYLINLTLQPTRGVPRVLISRTEVSRGTSKERIKIGEQVQKLEAKDEQMKQAETEEERQLELTEKVPEMAGEVQLGEVQLRAEMEVTVDVSANE